MGVMKAIAMAVGMRNIKRRPRMVRHALNMALFNCVEDWNKYKRVVLAKECGYSAWQIIMICNMAHDIREDALGGRSRFDAA